MVVLIYCHFFLYKIYKFLRYINMIVLTTSLEQGFFILPTKRVDEDGNYLLIDFVDKETKESYNFSENIIYTDKDLLFLGADDWNFFEENHYYDLIISFNVTNEVIYKDTVFITNQSVNTFTINNGEYTLPNINNNSYITL